MERSGRGGGDGSGGKKGKESVAGRKSRLNGRGIRRFLQAATRIRLGIGARKQDERVVPNLSLLRSVFLPIGIRDLHSGPVTISIDTRVKTAHGR